MNGLLHAGIVELTLACRIALQQPVNGVTDNLVTRVIFGNHIGELPRLELADRVVDGGLGLQLRLGSKAHVAAIRRGVGIFRDAGCDGCKIHATHELRVRGIDAPPGFGLAARFPRLVAVGRRGHGRHNDLRQVIPRLNQVEFGLVRSVERRNLRIGDIDLRLDLFVDELGLGQLPANVALQVVHRHVALLEQVVELILGVRSFDLGELGVHIFIARGQVQLGGLLLLNLRQDHLL